MDTLESYIQINSSQADTLNNILGFCEADERKYVEGDDLEIHFDYDGQDEEYDIPYPPWVVKGYSTWPIPLKYITDSGNTLDANLIELDDKQEASLTEDIIQHLKLEAENIFDDIHLEDDTDDYYPTGKETY